MTLGYTRNHVLGVRQPRERRDAAQHRQQVLEAAARLFGERGVESVTMDEIAHAAGVGKGTLYRRYGDKSQLVLALMDEPVAELQESLAHLPTYPHVLDALKAVLSLMAAWVDQHSAELGVVAEQRALQCSSLYAWMHGLVVDLLTDALTEGETDLVDPVYSADALLAALDVDLYRFQRDRRGYSVEQIEAGLHGLVDRLGAHALV